MRKLFAAFAIVAGAVAAMPALADASGAPNVALNPGQWNVCSELVSYGAITAAEFPGCLKLIEHGAKVEPFPGAGLTFVDQCKLLEQGITEGGEFFKLTYPYTFHEGVGDPFPDFRAHNTTQCSRALYAFHSIETRVIGPLGEGAEPQPGPTAGRRRPATPDEACATLARYGAIANSEVRGCVQRIAKGANFPPGPGAPTFVQRCAALEQGVTDPFPLKVTYPYTFHAGRYDFFPDLSASNRLQCSRALYVFHTIEATLPPI